MAQGSTATSPNGLVQEYNLGYARFEVLAVFASTILSQLAAMFVLKESLERAMEYTEIHTQVYLSSLHKQTFLT